MSVEAKAEEILNKLVSLIAEENKEAITRAMVTNGGLRMFVDSDGRVRITEIEERGE